MSGVLIFYFNNFNKIQSNTIESQKLSRRNFIFFL